MFQDHIHDGGCRIFPTFSFTCHDISTSCCVDHCVSRMAEHITMTAMGYTCKPSSVFHQAGSAVIPVHHISHVRGSSGCSNHAKHDYFHGEDFISSIRSIISSRRPQPRHHKVTGVNRYNLN